MPGAMSRRRMATILLSHLLTATIGVAEIGATTPTPGQFPAPSASFEGANLEALTNSFLMGAAPIKAVGKLSSAETISSVTLIQAGQRPDRSDDTVIGAFRMVEAKGADGSKIVRLLFNRSPEKTIWHLSAFGIGDISCLISGGTMRLGRSMHFDLCASAATDARVAQAVGRASRLRLLPQASLGGAEAFSEKVRLWETRAEIVGSKGSAMLAYRAAYDEARNIVTERTLTTLNALPAPPRAESPWEAAEPR